MGAAAPVKAGALTVPAGVSVCVCVPSAAPVKVCAPTVLEDPVNAGTPAGQAIVPVAVVTGLTPLEVLPVTSLVPLLVEAAVTALPVKAGTPAGQAMVPPGVTVEVALEPAGVPALTAEVAWFAVPGRLGAALVPAGGEVSEPRAVGGAPGVSAGRRRAVPG